MSILYSEESTWFQSTCINWLKLHLSPFGELVSSSYLPILACQHFKACPNMPRLGEKRWCMVMIPCKTRTLCCNRRFVYIQLWISLQPNHWKSQNLLLSVGSAPVFNACSISPVKILGSLTARAPIASRRPKLFRVCWTNPPEWFRVPMPFSDPCKK